MDAGISNLFEDLDAGISNWLSGGKYVTVTFAVRVTVTGTAGYAPLIVNRARLHDLYNPAEVSWSNPVTHHTYIESIYLPLIAKSPHR